jgi:hypothetical protein
MCVDRRLGPTGHIVAIGDYVVSDDGMIEILHEYERGELTGALEKLGLGKFIARPVPERALVETRRR